MLDSEFDGPSYIASSSRNDAVMLRCRDTIQRLHIELEDEKSRKKELQQQVVALETNLKQLRSDLQKEKSQKDEAEARVSRIERRAADAEAQLQTQKHNRETSGEQLQKLKTEVVQKGQELFAKGLRVSELEAAVKRAEARASAAQGEVAHITQELRASSERLVSVENEVSQLRANVEAEAARAERATQVCEERDRMCQALRQEADSARERLQSAEEVHRGQLAEAKKRQESLAASCREREADLRRSFTERTAEQSSVLLNTEVSDLRGRLLEFETQATTQERLVAQLRSDLAMSQSQQQSLQADHNRSAEALSARNADFARVQVELEASEQQVQRLTGSLQEERKDTQERWQAMVDKFKSEKEQLEEKLQREAQTGSESLQQKADNVRRLQEELKEMQEKLDAITREKERLVTESSNLQRQLDDDHNKHRQDIQRLETSHKAETAELEHMLESRDAQHTARGAHLEASYQRVSATLAECCSQHSLLEHQKSELAKSHEKVMQDHQEAHSQAAELTWRLDATNKELERSREALKMEHGKASRAKEAASQIRQSLGHAEGSASKASDLYAQSQRDCAQLKKELEQARQELDQAQWRQSTVLKRELEQAREEAKARTVSMMALEMKTQEMESQAASLALKHSDVLSRMQASLDNAESKATKEKHNVDMAESHAEGLYAERLRTSEAAAKLRLRDVELAAQEQLQAAELASATQLREMSLKLRETEDRHVAQTATASASFRAREAEVEAAAAKLSETKVEEAKSKYEQKMSKLYRQLSERQVYEQKLKSVIKNEVDILHQHNQELDVTSRKKQSKKADRQLVEDFIVDRMQGMAEKVEQRVLRSLRHPERH